MYTNISKYKNDKIKERKKEGCLEMGEEQRGAVLLPGIFMFYKPLCS
jgi:hypothetical protein